ncbi:MAG TPA: hypothetical protein VF595_17615 [Tepidisphaeraceae bacterium]|jgi:hypothetical protein
MRKAIITTLATALFIGGCATPKGPATWLEDPNAILVGYPPMAFIASQPGRLTVIDTTARSKIFFIDLSDGMVSGSPMLRLDGKRKALVVVHAATTQLSVKGNTEVEGTAEVELVGIDPTHHFVVTFVPNTRPPSKAVTRPSAE